MEHSVWRSRARILAYIDIIFSILVFIIGICVVIIFSLADDSVFKDEGVNATTIALWILVAVLGISVFFINLGAAVMLFKATKLGTEPAKALKRARIYRNVVGVFFILSLPSLALGLYNFDWPYVGLTLATLLIRGIFLYIFRKLIQEIQQAVVGISTVAYVHRKDDVVA